MLPALLTLLALQDDSVRGVGVSLPRAGLSPTYAGRHALVVGIDRYQDPTHPDLSFAVADARSVADALIQDYGFPQDNVRLLLDDAAHKQALEEAFAEWACDPARIGADDLLVIFFAGHGLTRSIATESQRGYLVPADGRVHANGTPAWSSLISMNELAEVSESVPAKHVLFVLDSCFGGLAVTRSVPPISAGLTSRARQILTAGAADQVVLDTGGQEHSVFTEALLDALHGEADIDEDGVVTFGELFHHVGIQVEHRTHGTQTPLQGVFSDHRGGNIALFPPLLDSGVRRFSTPGPVRGQDEFEKMRKLRDVWSDIYSRQEPLLATDFEPARNATCRQRLATTFVEPFVLPPTTIESVRDLASVFSVVESLDGIEVIVKASAAQAVYDWGATFTLTVRHPVAVDQLLNRLVVQCPDIDWQVRGDKILIADREDLRQPVIWTHGVHDLILEVIPPRGTVRLFDELGGPVLIEGDLLTSLITENVDKDSWDADGVSIEVFDDLLVVVNEPLVQERIDRFLRVLREALSEPPSDRLRQWTVDFGSVESRGRMRMTEYLERECPLSIDPFARTAFHSIVSGLATSLPFDVHVDPSLEDLDEEDLAWILSPVDGSLGALIDEIAGVSGVQAVLVNGALVFTRADVDTGRYLVVYDVRLILEPERDFPGRDVNVVPSGSFVIADEVLAERQALVVTGDGLDALIRDNVASETWEADPNNTLQCTSSGLLIVNQTAPVHARICELLEQLFQRARTVAEVNRAIEGE